MSDSGPTKPTALQRGQMRRRLRHQQRIREALLLDLGALVFELHRQGRREPELLQAKAAEVSAVDNEVRALAEALEADATIEMLAPGVAGVCGNCGTLLSTEDRFCPNCGTPSEPALSGDEPMIESSGNGAGTGTDIDETSTSTVTTETSTGDPELEEGETEVLDAAPPPTAGEPQVAPEGEESSFEDPGSRARRGVGRLFGRRPPPS
jgi:zinc ribbon protein